MADPRADAALDAYVNLLRTSRAVSSRVEPRLAAAGLTPTQFGVLETVLHAGALSQRELGRRVLTSAANMTDLIDKLEARGLVHRARQKLDRRAVLVELTVKGRTLVESTHGGYAREVAAAMAGLTGDELRQFSELLRKLGLVVAA